VINLKQDVGELSAEKSKLIRKDSDVGTPMSTATPKRPKRVGQATRGAQPEHPDVPNKNGWVVPRVFSRADVRPFDEVEWENRDALIGDPEDPAFEQREVEFPKSWSQNATNIVAQKYFRGQIGTEQRERSVKQMIGRVAGTIAAWGREGGYFASSDDGDSFEAELTSILLHQKAAFNSPVWFNVGFEERPQCSACFILSVEDTMESILDWNTKEGKIFRGGSGSGINLSNIRGSMEPLSRVVLRRCSCVSSPSPLVRLSSVRFNRTPANKPRRRVRFQRAWE